MIVASSEIAPVMKQAIVAIEDKRFFEHRGVDVRGIVRAVWQDVRNKKVVQGGSTITQQFVKNAYLTSKRSISRKLKEAALAWQLEQVWSKDRILTAYLNTIYFGNGAYGIERAAQVYFGHGASKLTLAEAALLAGIPRRPEPLQPGHRPEGGARAAARGAPGDARPAGHHLQRVPPGEPDAAAEAGGHPPARRPRAGAVLRRLRQAAARRPLRDAARSSAAGSNVKTTIDLAPPGARAEGDLEVAARARTGRPRRSSRSTRGTGACSRWSAARTTAQSQFNLAVQGERQPGSSFKPFVLATALEQGISPSTVLRVEAGDDLPRRPQLVRPQLRGLEPRLDRPDDGDGRTRTTRCTRS